MESRWTIRKKDGSQVGPLLSSEVRDFIRKGRVDLYDWVYKENSKFTLRLIDTDEIFNSSLKAEDSVYKASQDPFSNDIFKETDTETTKLNARNAQPTTQHTAPISTEKKIYYLTKDKKKFVGPSTASGIVSKYQANKNNQLLIKQEGSNTLVKIELFVKTFMYYKNSSSQNVMLNNLFKKKKSSKRLQEIKNNLDEKPRSSDASIYKIFGIMAVSVAILTVIIFTYPFILDNTFFRKSSNSYKTAYERQRAYNNRLNRNNNNMYYNNNYSNYNNYNNYNYGAYNSPNPKTTTQNNSYNFTEDNLLATDSIQIRPNYDDATSMAITAAPKTKNKNTQKTINTDSKTKATPAKNKVNSNKTTSANTNTSTSELNKDNSSQKLSKNTLSKNNKNPQYNTKPQTTLQQPQNPVVKHSNPSSQLVAANTLKPQTQVIKPQAKPQTQVAQNTQTTPTNPSQLEVGSVQTLYNMKFSAPELSLCSGKCDIEFYNNKLSIRGVFFKAAYAGILNKKQSVTITGTISKKGSGYSMFIQNIE